MISQHTETMLTKPLEWIASALMMCVAVLLAVTLVLIEGRIAREGPRHARARENARHLHR